nr:hypothetical protein YSBCXYJI_YSBCXYJI_CDS_0126 [Caudoviricetes sp.]
MCALVNEKVINMTLQDSVYNHVFKSKNEYLLVYVPELKDMINVVKTKQQYNIISFKNVVLDLYLTNFSFQKINIKSKTPIKIINNLCIYVDEDTQIQEINSIVHARFTSIDDKYWKLEFVEIDNDIENCSLKQQTAVSESFLNLNLSSLIFKQSITKQKHKIITNYVVTDANNIQNKNTNYNLVDTQGNVVKRISLTQVLESNKNIIIEKYNITSYQYDKILDLVATRKINSDKQVITNINNINNSNKFKIIKTYDDGPEQIKQKPFKPKSYIFNNEKITMFENFIQVDNKTGTLIIDLI